MTSGTRIVAGPADLGASNVIVDNGDDQAATLQVNGGVTIGNNIALNNGGALVNSGTISQSGPAVSGDIGVVTNLAGGSIVSTGDFGVYLSLGGTVSNAAGAKISGTTGIYADYPSDTAITVTNAGTITGTTENGVDLENGGTITNQAGGTIKGASYGVLTWGGTVTNTGAGSMITGTGGAGVNLADISALVNSDGAEIAGYQGVLAFNGSSVTNSGGATIFGQQSAVYTDVGASTVINTGAGSTISGVWVSVYLNDGGTVQNQDGATIVATGTGGAAVYLYDGGTVINGAGSNITGNASMGVYGIYGSGESTTVRNAGTITGDVRLDDYFSNQVTLSTGGTIKGDLYINTDTDSTLVLNGPGTQLYSQAVTGMTTFVGGTLTKQGSGTWIIDKSINAFTPALSPGKIVIDAGTLQVGNGNSGSTAGRITANVSNSGTLAFNRSDNLSYGGVVSGTGNLVKSGAGILTLTGNNTYGGGTTIAAGTLQVGSGSTSGAIVGDVLNSGTLAFNRSNAFLFGGAISGKGALVKSGAGTLTLTGDSTYSGDTTISAGTLQLGNGGKTGSILGNVVDNGTLAFNRSDTLTFSGNISGSGAVKQIGSGTTILTGTNTYTGDTTISAGTLQFGDGSSGGVNNVGGKLTVTGGALAIQTPATLNVAQGVTFADNTALSIVATTSGPSLSAESLTLGNDVAFNLRGVTDASQLDKVLIDTRSGISGDFGSVTVGGFSGTVDYLTLSTGKSADNLQYLATYGLSWMADDNLAHGTFTLTNATDSFTVGVALTDQVANTATDWNGTSLTKAGAGTLILAGDNTYSGGTTISAGTLQLGNADATGSILGNVVDNGILAFNRSDATVFSGAISGSGSVKQIGSGTTILTGDNTYGGGTTISGGTLQIGNGGMVGSILGDVTDNGTLVLDRSDAVTFSGAISGAGALVKQGSGTLTLAGDNSYSGGTTVADGTLSISSDGNLGKGGTLALLNGTTIAFTQGGVYAHAITVAGDPTFNVTADQTVTQSGAISDGASAGDIVKTGAGTLILTGTNSYSGGTTIEGGTLQIGNGGMVGSITGDVVDDDTLAFNRSNDLSFAGVISGTGSLRQIGSGKTELTGDSSTFAGETTVENGTLAVNGKLGGMLDVSSTGRLEGTGTVGDTIVNGTIAPGSLIDPLTVAGNIAFNQGSIYEVAVNAAGQADRIDATGTAAINGGTVQVINAPGVYALGSRYTILSATGGVSDAFKSLTQTAPFTTPFLSFGLGYDRTNVYLNVMRSGLTFASVGATRNQVAAGGGLDSVDLTSPLVAAMAQLDTSSARSALGQLSGEIHASAKTALIEDSRFVRNAVDDRLRAAFDGVGAPGCTVVTYEDGKPRAVAANTDSFAIWGQSFGSWGRTDGDGNAARLTQSTGGFFIGADAPVFETWRFGAVAGYSTTTFDAKSLPSSGSSGNTHLGLYGGTKWNVPGGDLAFRMGAAYTWHDISTSRSVVFSGFGDSLKAGYNAGTAQAFGELGYGIRAGNFAFEPFANLAYVNLHTDGFSEKGGAAGLTGQGATTDATFTTLGLHASTTFDLNGASVTAKGMIGWRYAFGDVTPLSTQAFSSGNAFTVAGVPIARDAAVVEAGLDMAITPAATLGLSYSGQIASADQQHTFKANFNVKF